MNNVYLYWVGKEYKLIKILRNMIYMHSTNGKGYKVNLINHDNIKEYIPDLPDYFYKLQPAHQADFARVYILCDKGGIWLDSDTLVVDKLDDLFDKIKTKDGFFIKQEGNISNGIFGTKPKTKLMINWKKTILDRLNKDININWTDIGNKILNDLKESYPQYFKNYYIYEGSTDMYPIKWYDCVEEYLNKPYANYKNIEKPFQPLLILVNKVYKELEKYSMEEIFNSKRPLNYFIEKSYRNKFKDIYFIFNKNK
jgi:hypothetical protein